MNSKTRQADVAIIGDHIKDIAFPSEDRRLVPWTKETAYTTSAQEQSEISGQGALRYFQQLFCLLLKRQRHENDGVDELERVSLQPVPEETKFGCTTHWTVAKCRRYVSDQVPAVYRAIERNASINPAMHKDAEMPRIQFKQDGVEFVGGVPKLLLIADYGRWTRLRSAWTSTEYEPWLTSTNGHQGLPKRVILLGNCLPKQCYDLSEKEAMWDVLFRDGADPNSTVVVTSVDRLRQEGAIISKRISWDATVLDFRRELDEFKPLNKLAKKCHLVVRFGVTGAIHCFPDGGGRIGMRFFYDPSPKQDFFRDRVQQGTAFGIRSVLPTCIAIQIYKQLTQPKRSQAASDPINLGIHEGISLLQSIYTAGFGPTIETMRGFISDGPYREQSLKESIAAAHRKSAAYLQQNVVPTQSPDTGEPEYSWFVHVVHPPDADTSPSQGKLFKDWTLLRDNLRASIRPDELVAASERRKGAAANSQELTRALKELEKLEQLRCLRMARAIVVVGSEAGLNRFQVPTSFKDTSGLPVLEKLDKILKIEMAINSAFQKRAVGDLFTSETEDFLLPERRGNAFPLTAPIARFGKMSVMGRTDIESMGSIRNLISSHMAGGRGIPLSLAAFGAPGSGKSFGVKEIARTLAGPHLEIYECNLSQLKDRHDLNKEFFNIFQIILKNKIPLVIFDEFDSMRGEEPLGWLKFFLEPMNDGKFRHSDGTGELSQAIFAFCGGTADTFSVFAKNANGKAVKLPDFISRLHGVINIEGLDRDGDGNIPYLRRALLLRAWIEEAGDLLSAKGVAQIDRNIVDAFLRVKTYNHGARSMKSVFGMFIRWNRGFQKVSIPTQQQLDLHTDGRHFLSLAFSRSAPVRKGR